MRSIICKPASTFQTTKQTIDVDVLTRADFVNDEEIQEIIRWESPYPSGTGADFTEEENAAMLRLPRKECKAAVFCFIDGVDA